MSGIMLEVLKELLPTIITYLAKKLLGAELSPADLALIVDKILSEIEVQDKLSEVSKKLLTRL